MCWQKRSRLVSTFSILLHPIRWAFNSNVIGMHVPHFWHDRLKQRGRCITVDCKWCHRLGHLLHFDYWHVPQIRWFLKSICDKSFPAPIGTNPKNIINLWSCQTLGTCAIVSLFDVQTPILWWQFTTDVYAIKIKGWNFEIQFLPRFSLSYPS